VDTKVASAHCISGACTYVLNENVPSEFVLLHVVPDINKQFRGHVALVLGRALLWCCFTPSLAHLVPLFIQDRVIQAYHHHPTQHLPEGVNPVDRRLVVITGDNENVSLTQVSPEEATERETGVGGSSQDLLVALMSSQMRQHKSQLEQLRLQCEQYHNQDRAVIEKNRSIINENLKRIAMVPAR
jgi:hypothetical protein